jgi:hypothetical protein
MRAVWIDEKDNPDGNRLYPRLIKRAYFAAAVYDTQTREWEPNTRLTKTYLYGADGKGGWRAAIGGVGIYRAGNWLPQLNEIDLAQQLDADLVRIGADNMQCAVHVNAEAHDFDIVRFLLEWRDLRPARDTSWVIEGMQGGRLSSAVVAAINRDPNLTVLAESFYDAGGQVMLPYDPDRVRADLIDAGLQRQRAVVMYDAAHLQDHWDGCAFTQGRLS